MQPRHLAPDKLERDPAWPLKCSGAPTKVMFWLNFEIEWQTQNGLQTRITHQKNNVIFSVAFEMGTLLLVKSEILKWTAETLCKRDNERRNAKA